MDSQTKGDGYYPTPIPFVVLLALHVVVVVIITLW